MRDSPSESPVLADEATALVQRSAAGDREAFGRLVTLHQDMIYRVAYHRLQRREEAEEAAQNAFLKAWRSLPELKDHGSFRPWLVSIAVNAARDRQRGTGLLARFFPRRVASCEEEGEDAVDPGVTAADPGRTEDAPARAEFWREVRRMCACLSDKEREAFFLRYLDDLDVREVAQVMKRSESAVKTWLGRAAAKLRADPGFTALARAYADE